MLNANRKIASIDLDFCFMRNTIAVERTREFLRGIELIIVRFSEFAPHSVVLCTSLRRIMLMEQQCTLCLPDWRVAI